MSNNTGFTNFPIETAAAFPSQTVAALPLPSTVQSSLDPLSVNDLGASAVAARLVQQHQTQVPFWPQHQETEFWPQTGQLQQCSTPRSPLGLTGPPPTTLQGMSANNWQSPLPPPPIWDANAHGFAVDRMVGMRAEKVTKVMVCHSWKSRIVTRYRSRTSRNQGHD